MENQTAETPVFRKSLLEIIAGIIGNEDMAQEAKERRLERDMVRSSRSISRGIRSGELTPEQAKKRAAKRAEMAVREAGYDPESEQGIRYAEKMGQAQERGQGSALSSAIRMLQAGRKDPGESGLNTSINIWGGLGGEKKDPAEVNSYSSSNARSAVGCQSII